MRTPQLNERGIALVIAIFALVVIGALVAGTFFVGRLEQRMGRSTVYGAQAAAAADAGLAAAMDIDQSVYSDMAVAPAGGSDLLLPTTYVIAGKPSLRYTATVRRLTSSLFLVRSVGERVASNGVVLGSDEHGVMMRLERAIVKVNSAITVMQPIKLNGNAFTVTGINTNQTGWDIKDNTYWKDPCPDVTNNGDADDKVGIRSATSTGVDPKDTTNVNGTANVNGKPTPAVANDTSVTSSTFRDFVDKTFASMTKQPGVKVLNLDTPYNGVAPVITNGVCDKTAPYNFGEPTHPSSSSAAACYNYFPVVNGTGSQTKFAAGSRGQGTLLIEGDMEINGNFEWTGLIIVRGSIKINGNGNKITGAVLAESVTDNNTIGGNVDIKYSACAIDKAVKGSATPTPLGQRGWMQLY